MPRRLTESGEFRITEAGDWRITEQSGTNERALTVNAQTETSAEQVTPIMLVKLEFDSGDLLLWSGLGDFTYNSETYTGAGDLLRVAQMSESAQIRATNATLTLSGIPSTIIALAIDEDYQERSATIYQGFLDATGALVEDPFIIFKGRMDVMTMSDDGQNAEILLTVEENRINLNRAFEVSFTLEDHQLSYPDDTFFEFIAGVADKEIVWGKSRA